MNTLERIRKQVQKQLESAYQTTSDAVELAFETIANTISIEQSQVFFPEELPCTIVSSLGSVRLEPIAFAMFRYCWFVYLIEGREKIPFAELGEKIYNNAFKPKSTIQNTVRRGEKVELIGILYFYSGEYVFVQSRL